MDLNNRQTGKDATKPRTLGLLGHSEVHVYVREVYVIMLYKLWHV